jgi:hypothetical protein
MRAPCSAFRWIGQTWASCDRCGEPAWEHDFIEKSDTNSPPFDDPGVPKPWDAKLIGEWLMVEYISAFRARWLLKILIKAEKDKR